MTDPVESCAHDVSSPRNRNERREHVRTVDVDELTQAQRDVSRARRSIDHEHVEVVAARTCAPVDIKEQLLNRLHDHHASPDDRRVGIVSSGLGRTVREEEPHRHAREAVRSQRSQTIV